MKKKKKYDRKRSNYLKKLCLLACLSLLPAAQAISSNGIQKEQPSESMTPETLLDLFSYIEKHSQYIFIYHGSNINLNQRIRADLNHKSVTQLLDEAFAGTNLSYSVKDRQIIVKREEKALSASQSPTQGETPKKTIQVRGVVKDKSGQPLIGVNIIVKGSVKRGITDMNGGFTLQEVDPNAMIQFSYVGYRTQQTAVKPVLSVILQEDDETLDEIVVVGYGTQKKVNLTGAIEQVGSEVFENRSLANVTQALQGSIPNLNLKLEDGKPTRSAQYNVRGTTSIGQGGSALVLIDGVEGDPSLLNPNDIESVTALKDAASSAIYGARGSFGVILINTKNPVKGKTNVNYTGNFSLQAPSHTPDFVTDGVTWAEHFRAAYVNYNNALPTTANNMQSYSDQWLETFKQRKAEGNTTEVETNANGSFTYYANTDWYGLLYKDQVFAQDHNLTISGGSEKSDFFISGRFYDYDGLYNYNPDTYKSLNLRAKGSLQVFDWLKVYNNMEFSNADYHSPFVSSYSYNVQRYIELASFPSIPLYNPDGSFTRSGAYSLGAFISGTNEQDTGNKLLKNTTSFAANFLNNKLHIKGDFTFRYKTYDKARKRLQVPYSDKENVVSYVGTAFNDFTEENSKTNYTATNLYAEYEDTFNKKHYVKGMIGYNYETSRYKQLSVLRNGVLLENAESINLALGESITTSANAQNWKILGAFFRLNYGFDNRYLLEVNGRYDGSSKFPSNEQYAFFPSVSAAWRITEEPFYKIDRNILSDAKVRVSYGSLGNGNIPPYSFMELLSINTSGRVLNGAKNKYTSSPAVVPNSLTWETATTSNLGLDLSFLNGRMRFTGDYYVRKTTDMYTVGVTLPDVFGATSPKGNYADMTTKGYEISLAYNDQFTLANKPFHFEIRGTLHDYQSTIDRYNNQTMSLSDYYEGMTIGEVWGYKTDGLFQSESETESYVNTIFKSSVDGKWKPGDLKIVDLNGNGKIDYGDNTLENHGDKVIVGNTEPRYMYSATFSGSWSNFFFSAFFQGVGKQDWFPGKESSFWGQYNRPYNNVPKWHLNNYWTEDNPNAYLPRYSTYNAALGWNDIATDRYKQNIAYLRLKNLQFGYTFPKQLVSKAKIQNLKVYVSGENLASWSPLYKRTKDYDVSNVAGSTDSDLNSNSMGDGNSYPLMKSVSFGLSVTF